MSENKQRVKEKLAALSINEERFQTIVSMLQDIIYLVNDEGMIEFINPAIRGFGWEPEELIGKHFSELLTEECAQRVSREHFLKGKVSGHGENDVQPKLFDERRTSERSTIGLQIELREKEGLNTHNRVLMPLVGEVNSVGLYHKDAPQAFVGTIGIIRNITERKAQDRALQQLIQELEAEVERKTQNLLLPKSCKPLANQVEKRQTPQ